MMMWPCTCKRLAVAAFSIQFLKYYNGQEFENLDTIEFDRVVTVQYDTCFNFEYLIVSWTVPVAAGGTIPLTQVPPSHQIHTGHVQPTTVRAVESAYFKQHQYIQQMARPLAEVLGAGNFFFLQESELDSPDVPNNNQNTERPPVCQIGVSADN